MRLSSGARHALSQAASWLFVVGMSAATFIWFDDISAAVATALGKSAEDSVYVAETSPQSAQNTGGGSVVLRAGSHGHFSTTAYLNGRPVQVLVDTGASMVALSYEDAERIGVFVRPSDFTARARTANGPVRMAPVVLDSVSIGDIELSNVEASVSEPGRLGTTLLGMTFIGRLSRTEMRNGVLTLEQ
jgi:aspartyl protease family protein